MHLCVFGDSFVAGIGDPCRLGWVGRAIAALNRPQITLYNLGVRGQTGADILARLHCEAAPRLELHALNQRPAYLAPIDAWRRLRLAGAAKPPEAAPGKGEQKSSDRHPSYFSFDGLSAQQPGRIILSFGANDCAAGPDNAPRRTADQSINDLQAALTVACALAPTLMVGPAPIADDPAADSRIAALCPQFHSICAQRGIPYIPVHANLRAAPLWMHEALSGDGAHPGKGGYATMAELIADDPQWNAFFQET
jgi:acyl-CoA thioesterase I